MLALSRTGFNFLVGCLLLVLLTAVIGVTCIVQFAFPAGTAAAGWTLWGVGYDGWSRAQGGCLGFFVLTVLLHLILHWTWICGFVASRLTRLLDRRVAVPPDGVRTIYGVSLLITLITALVGLLIAAQFAIRSPNAG